MAVAVAVSVDIVAVVGTGGGKGIRWWWWWWRCSTGDIRICTRICIRVSIFTRIGGSLCVGRSVIRVCVGTVAYRTGWGIRSHGSRRRPCIRLCLLCLWFWSGRSDIRGWLWRRLCLICGGPLGRWGRRRRFSWTRSRRGGCRCFETVEEIVGR